MNRNPFNTILDEYRQIAFSERDKGNRFEQLMKAYLLNNKQCADQFTVWTENQIRMMIEGNEATTDYKIITIQNFITPFQS